jgi:cytochrome oxidase Cu insertion factor (SCO1/SenC/PrrC family)
MAEPAHGGGSVAAARSRRPFAATDRRGRLTLLILAATAIAPVIASYVTYYFFPREPQANYGTLLATPAPALVGARFDGTRFALADLRGRWTLLVVAGGRCAGACERMLYATRQARTMQGRDQDRVVRAVVLTGDEPPQRELIAQHGGLIVARCDERAVAALPSPTDAIYLVDPLGNLVLSYPADPDIKRLAKDLERVLRASSIG